MNVLGGMRVLEGAVEAGVRNIVFASSLAAYAPAPLARPGRTCLMT